MKMGKSISSQVKQEVIFPSGRAVRSNLQIQIFQAFLQAPFSRFRNSSLIHFFVINIFRYPLLVLFLLNRNLNLYCKI